MPTSPGKQFGAQVEPYLDKLFRAAYRLTGNQADAQDLVQDTCVRAFMNADGFARADLPLAWLMRVQYNLFIDGTRRRKTTPVQQLEATDFAHLAVDERADPALLAAENEWIASVQRAAMSLNKDQRALIALSIEGYSLTEMSEITGLSVGAIQSRLHRARRSLVRYLREDPGVSTRLQAMEIR